MTETPRDTLYEDQEQIARRVWDEINQHLPGWRERVEKRLEKLEIKSDDEIFNFLITSNLRGLNKDQFDARIQGREYTTPLPSRPRWQPPPTAPEPQRS